MVTKRFNSLAITCLISGLCLLKANAAIIVVAPTETLTGSLQITQDVSFTINTAITGSEFAFVLDEWVTADADQTVSPLVLDSENTFDISVYDLSLDFTTTFQFSDDVGGSPVNFIDNSFFDFGTSVTANDGLVYVSSDPSFEVGDVVTLLAGTYTISSGAGSNPLATQTFTGNMFIADGSGNQISDLGVVPELKASALLLGVVALSLTVIRRRYNIR